MKQLVLENKISVNYAELLDKIQNYIKGNYSSDVTALIDSNDKDLKMKSIIKRSLIMLGCYSQSNEHIDDVAESLYQDMAGNGFLSKYLGSECLEEINVNGWNNTEVIMDGNKIKTDECFLSPQHAEDVIKRIASKSGVTIDDAVPGMRASITKSIRIAALKAPIVEQNVGVVASIRKVNSRRISEKQLLTSKAATSKIIEFLYFCIRHGVSVCFAGATGSGKTTIANWLLSKIPYDKRIITLEEGARELDLKVLDGNGRLKNDVISLLAHPSKIPEQNFDLIHLLDYSLWFDPDYIVVGEMRSYEAYTAQEAARTGHTVITTIHSNDAESTYRRMMTLAKRYPGLKMGDDMLMSLMVEAFPIIVYMKKLEDGSRRIMEVMEGVGYSREKGVISNPIFRFNVESNMRKEKKLVISGKHEQENSISKKLERTLLNNGADWKSVKSYAG